MRTKKFLKYLMAYVLNRHVMIIIMISYSNLTIGYYVVQRVAV